MNQTIKDTCVEHFFAMFAAKRPQQRRSNSSELFFVRRNNLRSKVSFEENTPSGGSHGIVGVRTSGLSEVMIFLKLEHEVLGSNWGTLVPLVPEWSGMSKASRLVSSKEQVNLIREKRCSVFEKPVIPLGNLLEVLNKSKNHDSGWCRPLHLRCCRETFVLEQQVDSIGDVDQVVHYANLSMHAVQACDLVGKVGLHEAVPVPPVEFFDAYLKVGKPLRSSRTIGSLVRSQAFCFH